MRCEAARFLLIRAVRSLAKRGRSRACILYNSNVAKPLCQSPPTPVSCHGQTRAVRTVLYAGRQPTGAPPASTTSYTLNIRCFRIAKCMRNKCTIRATTKPEIPQRQTARNSTQSSQVTSTSPSSRLLVSYSSRGSTRGERVGGWCDSLTPWASRACASRSCDGLSLTPRRFGGASWRQAPGHP